ncbi:MAG: PAS domain S-box protein, partial [Bacteroidetes bacterium]|nr:PAS domain S-box protein [Bacteroidota bacterium]
MNSRKVIVVEDDKLLATVFSMFLKELGHDLTGFFTDGTRAIEKCEEELPDVILMDIHIPGEIDGIRAAEIIQEKYDIPVIFITGDTDSETVKRALRTRSYGYLVKPIDKTELGINIQLACIKNKYDRDIRIREKRYRSLLDVSQDTIMLIVNGIIEYVNYAGLRMFETIHIEDLLEKPFFSFVPEEYQEGLSRCFRELFDGKTGKIEYSPFKIRSLNNKLYTVGIVGSAVDFKNEKAIQMVITNQTEYLETRRLVTEQHNVIENIHDGIITMSLNGTVSSWNAGAERIFGRKKEDVEGKSITTLFPDKDEMELQKIFLEQPLEEQNTETVIDFFDTRNGQTRHLQFTLSVLTNSGNETTGIVCYCTDITERKQKTETLRNSRANLKAIFDSSTEAIFFIDDEYRIIDYNRLAKQYVRKFFKKEVETGVSVLHLLSFLDNSEYEQLFENALDGIAHYLERAVLTGDKKQFFKITIYPITTEDDSSTNRFCISFLDITERKRTEKELVETHAELKPLFDSSIQRFYLADPDYKLVAFNKSAREIIKKENKHNLQKGDNLLDFVPPEIGEEEFIRKFNTAIGGKNVVFKAKLSYENESYWIEGHLDPIKDETGETKRILFWTIDISEREENLAALKKSEERYALIASGSNDGLWDWDMVNDELYVSPRWKAVIGYDADVEISSNEMKENLIHPDDIGAMHLTLQKYLDGEIKTYVNEFRIKHRSGEYHWIMERGTVLRDETGKPYRFAGSITDITDAKKAEE